MFLKNIGTAFAFIITKINSKRYIMVALFVVLTFILFIVVDLFVLKAQKKKHPAFAVSHSFQESHAMFNKKSFALPHGIVLTKLHVWLNKVNEQTLRIGIDDFVTKALGAVHIIPAVEVGSYVEKGQVVFNASVNDKKIQFRSPIEGTLINVNSINKEITDPYNNDWIFEIQPKDGKTNPLNAIKYEEAVDWVKNEFRRLRDFIIEQSTQPTLAGVTMYDGGNLVEGVVSYLGDEAISKFEKEFLS